MKHDLLNLLIILGVAFIFAWLVREVRRGIGRINAATAGLSKPKRELLTFFIIACVAVTIAAIVFVLSSGIVDRLSTLQVLVVTGGFMLLPPSIQWMARRMKRV